MFAHAKFSVFQDVLSFLDCEEVPQFVGVTGVAHNVMDLKTADAQRLNN